MSSRVAYGHVRRGCAGCRVVVSALRRPPEGDRRGLLQATSLTFIVVAARLGVDLKVFDSPTGAAPLAAGLPSVVVYPPIALVLLAREADTDGGSG